MELGAPAGAEAGAAAGAKTLTADTAGGATARARAIANTRDIVDPIIGAAGKRRMKRGQERGGTETDVSASGAGRVSHRRARKA